LINLLFMMREGPLMGSDAFAPAFVHKVLDPLEIGGPRSNVAIRVIDDFGEMRQFDLLGLRKQIVIKVLKQRIAGTRRFRKSWQQAAYTPTTADCGLGPRSVGVVQQSHLPKSVEIYGSRAGIAF
jgi:hypothetical protein